MKKLQQYFYEALHSAIRATIETNIPRYINKLGGISFEPQTYKIVKNENGIEITEKGIEVFTEISQLYRNATSKDVHKNNRKSGFKVVDNTGESNTRATIDSVESDSI